MDELIIEDRKYISSKRAADITGYAKDYVGQLCREGHVSARRVGRNWYVLETAIRDHRFGTSEKATDAVLSPPPHSPEASPAWESPRYEPVEHEALPSINHIRPEPVVLEPEEEASGEPQELQDAWQSWFDSFRGTGHVVTPDTEEAHITPTPTTEEDLPIEMSNDAPTEQESEALAVPLHFLPEDREPGLPGEIFQREREARYTPLSPRHPGPPRKGFGRGTRLVIQTIVMLTALISVGAAVLGTGYFDTKIVSDNRVGIIAGVATYQKSIQ